MTFLRATALLVLAILGLAACSPHDAILKLTDPLDRAFALEAVERLQACDAAYIADVAEPTLRTRAGPLTPRMCAFLPKGAGAKARLVDATVMGKLGVGGFRRSFFTYEVDDGPRHALVRVGVMRMGSKTVLSDLFAGPLPMTIEETTAFSLIGKSPVQYLFLVMAVAMTGLSLSAFILVIVTKGVRRKWLWAIGCLIAFGQFVVNWSSGAIGFQLLAVEGLGGFAMKRHLSEPWQVGFGIPVFAILFLIRRKAMQEAGRPRKPQLNL